MNPFKKEIKQIVLHTASFDGPCDAEEIRKWHLERGFDEIGYHYVITGSTHDSSSEIEYARPLLYRGAHAYGSNGTTIGICVTGHGDIEEWSKDQIENVCLLVNSLRFVYGISIKNVIGHGETKFQKLNRFKTCPGKKINMDKIRKLIKEDEPYLILEGD